MNVAGDDVSEPTNPCPACRLARQQRRFGICLVEIFEDRQRLDQGVAVRLQRRHQPLRIDRKKAGFPLVATAQMDERALVVESFEVQRDAHAKRGGGAEIAVKLHAGALSPSRGPAPRNYSAAAVAGRAALKGVQSRSFRTVAAPCR